MGNVNLPALSLAFLYSFSYIFSFCCIFKQGKIPRGRLYIASFYPPLIVLAEIISKKLDYLSIIPGLFNLFLLTLVIFAFSSSDVLFFLLYPYAWLWDKLRKTTSEPTVKALTSLLFPLTTDGMALAGLIAFFWLLPSAWIIGSIFTP